MAMHPKLQKQTDDHIKRFGRTVIGVFDDGSGEVPFMYTIGNCHKGGTMPELLLVGICTEQGRDLLNVASDVQNQRERAIEDGELVSIGGQFPLKAIDVSNAHVRDEYTIQAGQYYGDEGYPVIQLLMCDKEGRFPGEPKCARPYSGQPLLNKKPRARK